METKVGTVLRILALAFLSFLVPACGGGGGGGGGGGTSAIPTAYKGVQTQAVIGQGNAEEIALSAYSGGSLGSGLTAVTPLGQSSQTASTGLGAVLTGAVEKMKLTSTAARTQGATPIDIPSPCGGGRLTGSLDDSVIGSFTGHLTFDNFCEGEAVLNGNVLLSGVRNQATGEAQVTFNFNTLSIAAPDDSYVVEGTMSTKVNESSPTTTLGVNLVLRDTATGKTEFMNYSLTSTAGDGYAQSVIAGRYYSHDHGYVDVTTETPVRVPQGENLPEEGVLRLSGGGGTWAKLTFDGFGFYRIDTSDRGYIQQRF